MSNRRLEPARRALGPWLQTTGFQPFSLSVGGEVRRKLLNPSAVSWCCDARSHGGWFGTRYGPNPWFHQQYPTWDGRKVTRGQMPTDTVPTVIRLAPEPRGDGVSASIRRRGGWMGGMVNTCELLINVVTSDKPKMLTGLSQNGTVAGTGSCFYPVMDTERYRRIESTSPVTVNLVERGKPVSLLP